MIFSRFALAVILIFAAAAGSFLGNWVFPQIAMAESSTPSRNVAQKSDAVPEICTFSRNAVLTQSKIGKVADKRLVQLARQASKQLAKERKPLEQDIRSFQDKSDSLSVKERKEQQHKLRQRRQAFQQKDKVINARLRYTRARVRQRVNEEISPLLVDASKTHGCGVVLDRKVVLGGDRVKDITPIVIQSLDKKATTISFGLMHLPKQSSDDKKQGNKDAIGHK